MFSILMNRMGIPGVISVIALVFAMLGGAYAASNGATTSKSKAAKGPRGPKGPKGDTGPAGAQGSPGAAGAKGATGPQGNPGSNGTNGTNGTNGADGKTVLNGATPPTSGLGSDGDFYINTATDEIYGPKAAGAWGSGTSLKGAAGPAGPTETTLPSGKAETGLWSFKSKSIGFPRVTLSFPFRLTFNPTFHYIKCTSESCEATTECPSTSPADPKAAAGQLCVYAVATENAVVPPETNDSITPDKTSGLGMEFEAIEAEETSKAWGAWAVQAP
jgi:hypothetical protein